MRGQNDSRILQMLGTYLISIRILIEAHLCAAHYGGPKTKHSEPWGGKKEEMTAKDTRNTRAAAARALRAL